MRQARPLRLEENCFAGDGLGSLFHHPDYFRLHSPGEGDGLYIEGFDRDRLMLVLPLAPEAAPAGPWRSPRRGTYAAYAVAPELSTAAWADAHARIERRLVELATPSLELLLPPAAHSHAEVARQTYLLLSHGWQVVRCDLNFALEVSGEFETHLDADHRRRLRNALACGVAAQVLPPTALHEVHALIAEGYRAKGREVSLSYDALSQMRERFAQRLVLVGCQHAGRLVGGTIALEVDRHVLYIYAWSAAPQAGVGDVVTVMARCLYHCCLERGLRLLDGGTASIGASLDGGLAEFKRGLGMRESLKLRLAKPFTRAET